MAPRISVEVGWCAAGERRQMRPLQPETAATVDLFAPGNQRVDEVAGNLPIVAKSRLRA